MPPVASTSRSISASTSRKRPATITSWPGLTDDQRNLRTVTPGYVEGMTNRWIALYHGEVAAAQYMGVAAHNVPMTDYWDFIACCVCQQTDELQHSEMDRDMLFRAA